MRINGQLSGNQIQSAGQTQAVASEPDYGALTQEQTNQFPEGGVSLIGDIHLLGQFPYLQGTVSLF
jgi:hypothetical protein